MAKGAPKGLVPGQVVGLAGPAGKVPTFKPGTLHRHGCVQCGLRYDDACQTPAENGVCTACRTGRPRVLWLTSMDPADCCRQPKGSRQMDFDSRSRYSCAGDTLWWQCKTCARTHPYDPTTPRTGAPTE